MVRAVGIIKRIKKMILREKNKEKSKEKPKVAKIDVLSLKEAVENWQKQVTLIEDHPLSQARVLNTQVLQGITAVMESLDVKLEDLKKLDDILDILKSQESTKKEINPPKSALELALSKVGYLTVKDRAVIKLLEEKGALSAEDVGKELKLSRSTVSYRLNRLHNMGILKKEAEGRTILFRAVAPENN